MTASTRAHSSSGGSTSSPPLQPLSLCTPTTWQASLSVPTLVWKSLLAATKPGRLKWLANNSRAIHSMPETRLLLLGTGTTSNEALHSGLIPSVHVGLDAEGDAAWEVHAPTMHQCSQAAVFAAATPGALWKQDSSQRWCTSQPLGGPQAKANLALLKDRQQAQAVIPWNLRRRPAARGSGVQLKDAKKKSTAFPCVVKDVCGPRVCMRTQIVWKLVRKLTSPSSLPCKFAQRITGYLKNMWHVWLRCSSRPEKVNGSTTQRRGREHQQEGGGESCTTRKRRGKPQQIKNKSGTTPKRKKKAPLPKRGEQHHLLCFIWLYFYDTVLQ